MPDYLRQSPDTPNGPTNGEAASPSGRRRARAKIDSSAELALTEAAAEQQRQEDAARRRRQTRWQAPPPSPVPGPSVAPRFSAPSAVLSDQPTVRPAPKMPRRQKSAPVNSRPMIVLGAVLLAGL